jgi:hypothetical protein
VDESSVGLLVEVGALVGAAPLLLAVALMEEAAVLLGCVGR